MHAVAAKKIIKKAFRLQTENKCFSLVEVLSTCPTNWGNTPFAATEWVATDMQPYYPLGIFKDPEGENA
jgi:2-oxoglutarate ferredoxin oxidoreductase subunit beta